MALTTYAANKVLDLLDGKMAFSLPTVYVGAMTANPTAAGTQTSEATWTSYARVATTGATWNAGSAGASNNAAAINFAAKTGGADQTVTYWATFDAATAGNMLEFGPLSVAQTITTGSTLSFPAGNAPRTAA